MIFSSLDIFCLLLASIPSLLVVVDGFGVNIVAWITPIIL